MSFFYNRNKQMTLTVVVGSSGSGKTTYLEDLYKQHKCVYIRQYHALRPYIAVRRIPNFDPTCLPYWKLYADKTKENGAKNESYNPNVKIGGTMAGEFTSGLSGGQRKMMLFELVRQRVRAQSNLLIILDEPFAGVTDDFLPFITVRINEMRQSHNIVLVTNDHVSALTGIADSILKVSAVDRGKVAVNDSLFDRDTSIHAISEGNAYEHKLKNADLWFFIDTEILRSPQIGASLGFTFFAMAFFLISYWDSSPASEALVLVALQIIAFFAINPFLISLTDWRNLITEEADALMHCSVDMNLALKSVVTLLLLIIVSLISFACLVACLNTPTIQSFDMWISMLFDSASLTLPFICLGLYSRLPLQFVQIIASLPFLFMIFFSTTFSPGAGLVGVKALRYIFARFYLWCRIPLVGNSMEGCPEHQYLTGFSVLTGSMPLIIFLLFQLCAMQLRMFRKSKHVLKHEAYITDADFIELKTLLRPPLQVQSIEERRVHESVA